MPAPVAALKRPEAFITRQHLHDLAREIGAQFAELRGKNTALEAALNMERAHSQQLRRDLDAESHRSAMLCRRLSKLDGTEFL